MIIKLLQTITFCFLSINCIAQNQLTSQIDDLTKNQVLVNVYKTIEDYYVFPNKSEIIIKSLKGQDSIGKYKNINNPNEFAFSLTTDIKRIVDDNHLRIIYDPKLEQDILRFTSSRSEADRINSRDLLQQEKQNFYFKKVEILPGNVGYLEFTQFTSPNSSSKKTVQAAMQFLSHTDALVIDLRNNFGGKSNEIASYFFNKKTFTGRTFNKIDNKWRDQYVTNKKNVTDGIIMNMPVYILTSARTFSAAEGFAYTLQTLRNAIVVGDTTRGGAHLTRSFSVGNGFVAFVPYMRGENSKTKTDWEGTGIIPNIYSENDKSLFIAQKAALTKKLSETSDDTEARKITWTINFLQAQNCPLKIDISEFMKVTGQFSEFEISIREGILTFRDTHQRTLEYKPMIAISPTLFQVGKDYQVEFIKDQAGEVNSIKMFWEDGWTEIIQKTN